MTRTYPRGLVALSALGLLVGACGERSDRVDAGPVDAGSATIGDASLADAAIVDAATGPDAGPREVRCAQPWQSTESDMPSDLAALPSGGVVLTAVTGQPDVVGGPLGFLVAGFHECERTARWSTWIEAPVVRAWPSVAVRSDGEIVVVGSFGAHIVLDGETVMASGEATGFVLRFGPDGAYRGATFLRPEEGVVAFPTISLHDAAIDPLDGALWLVGDVSGRFQFAEGPVLELTSFVARIGLDPGGSARGWPIPGRAGSIGVGPDGPILSGTFDDPTDFGQGVVTPSDGDPDVFVLALDSDAATRWVRPLGDEGAERAPALAVADDGTTHLLFEYYQTPGVDGAPETLDWARALVTLGPDGALRWAQPAGFLVEVLARSRVAVTREGIFVPGAVTTNAPVVGDTTVPIVADSDAFLAHFDASGALLRLFRFPNRGSARAHAVAFDGAPVAAVAFGAELAVGEETLEAAGNWDLTLLRLE